MSRPQHLIEPELPVQVLRQIHRAQPVRMPARREPVVDRPIIVRVDVAPVVRPALEDQVDATPFEQGPVGVVGRLVEMTLVVEQAL